MTEPDEKLVIILEQLDTVSNKLKLYMDTNPNTKLGKHLRDYGVMESMAQVGFTFVPYVQCTGCETCEEYCHHRTPHRRDANCDTVCRHNSMSACEDIHYV